MSDGTKIEWTDATVNAVNGCSVVSPGCTNCYAMRLAGTRMKHHPSRAGLTIDTKAGPVWNGEVRLSETALMQPLRWKRPHKIFWNAHGDLFHPAVPDEWIDRCFAVMALTPQHIHQVLTKRPERMREYIHDLLSLKRSIFSAASAVTSEGKTRTLHLAFSGVDEDAGGLVRAPWKPLPNVWLGTSVEDQTRADERIPHLLATPAAVRFLSCEPLLGPIDLTNITGAEKSRDYGSPVHGWSCIWRRNGIGRAWIDWVIAGGESGPGARPMHPDWARSLRDQCAAAGVAFHFKQWGEFVPCETADIGDRLAVFADGADSPRFQSERAAPVITAHKREFWKVGKRAAGRLLDGVEHNGMPA